MYVRTYVHPSICMYSSEYMYYQHSYRGLVCLVANMRCYHLVAEKNHQTIKHGVFLLTAHGPD